jgi:hypothetical protein
MKRKTLTTAVMILLGSLTYSATLLASDSDSDVNTSMSRISADAPSGSGATVRGECGGGVDGFDSARATIKISTAGGSSKVKIKLRNGKPNTHYTVWLRMKGNDQDGNSFGGAPLTGGGATPLAPSSELAVLIPDWIDPAGSLAPRANGFITNARGNGKLKVALDFPMSSGAYPFNRIDAATLAAAQGKNANAKATPTAVVDPTEDGVSGPFLIRMVSHCQDGRSHGVSPANRESWFQFP